MLAYRGYYWSNYGPIRENKQISGCVMIQASRSWKFVTEGDQLEPDKISWVILTLYMRVWVNKNQNGGHLSFVYQINFSSVIIFKRIFQTQKPRLVLTLNSKFVRLEGLRFRVASQFSFLGMLRYCPLPKIKHLVQKKNNL